MNKSCRYLDVEAFRSRTKKELNESNSYLCGWLEGKEWIDNKRLPVDSRKPWVRKGREYIDFYETFYSVLSWYKLWKISRFKELGWKIEEKVVENIEDKFTQLIRYALESKQKDQFHEYFKNYNPRPLSYYTAIDFKFQNVTGTKINNILDFGSGIGRQAYQWCSREDVNFFSIDAIESLYLLQNKIYSLLFPEKLKEYFDDPQGFRNIDFNASSNQLYHLPTWRIDLLPEKYFDLIICVQVLQEINEKTLRYVLTQFKRIIKNNGFLYIRDNEFWMPSHKVRVGRELLRQGWELIFRYTGEEGTDIEGVPRLWVYSDADNRKYFTYKRRIKRTFFPEYILKCHTWKDYGLPI